MSDLTKQRPTTKGAAYFSREVLTIPNAVTLLRVLCVIGMFAWRGESDVVFTLAMLAWVSDGIDGYLAKTFGWCTKFGARFDQYADWVFGVALLYAVFVEERFTLTLYNSPLLGLIVLYLLLRMRYYRAKTIEVAKRKTFIQFLGALTILAGHAFDLEWLRVVGYVILYLSLPLMYISWRGYALQNNT